MTEEEMINLHRKIEAGVKAAVAQAIERHRSGRESISFMENRKIITLTAPEIPQMQVDDKV